MFTSPQEHFMPYFAAAGYDSYAVSLRAQGGSGGREDPAKKVAGTLDTHAADLASVVGGLPQRPVVVAHSFSGLILQK
jgi:non-heme chloroperoxidase